MPPSITRQYPARSYDDVMNRRDVSLRAKGLFAYIITRPKGWQGDAGQLATTLKEPLVVIESALDELESLTIGARA